MKSSTLFMALMYHDLSNALSDIYTVSFDEFKKQVTWLHSNGFVIEGFDGLEKRLVSNLWPKKYVVMTFDDGYKSSLQAAEILLEVGAGATFFVTKSYSLTQQEYLTPNEIRQLSQNFSIGSHSVSHPYLTKLSPEAIAKELVDSRLWAEDVIGRQVRFFSAPHGLINAEVYQLAQTAGYTLVGNSVEWFNNSAKLSQKKIVNRIALRSFYLSNTFLDIITINKSFLTKRMLRSYALSYPKQLLSPEAMDFIRKFLKMK